MGRRMATASFAALVCGLWIASAFLGAQEREGERRRGDAPPGGGRPPAMPVIAALDANGDGEMSADELENATAALKKLDRNGDGKLAQEEFRPRFGRGRGGPPRGGGGRAASGGEYDNPPLPKDDEEKKTLASLEDAREGPRFANVSRADGRLLRLLAEAVGAKRVVEIGTSTGESATWFALALRATGGRLFTHEIDSRRAAIARENFNKAGVGQLITVIEGDAHETVKQHKEPIDILFLDADKQGYLDYLDKLLPLVRPGGLVIAHNMRMPAPNPKYIEAITKDPKLETSFLLMDGAGVGVTLKKR